MVRGFETLAYSILKAGQHAQPIRIPEDNDELLAQYRSSQEQVRRLREEAQRRGLIDV